ncbi:MAG: hypothetical protein IJY46_00740, partial [Lentisphaeria bacterium]|nr:hypothetical protein [Lentisphaeria bacterium]
AYCSASSARAEFLQRVRRLLTGGSLRPACALGGNRLASLFQDEVLQQLLFFIRTTCGGNLVARIFRNAKGACARCCCERIFYGKSGIQAQKMEA